MGELAAGGMAIDPECLDLGSRPLANFPEQRINRREGPLVTRTKVAIGVPETAIIIGPALREILLVESGRDQDERVGVGKRPPFVAIAIRVAAGAVHHKDDRRRRGDMMRQKIGRAHTSELQSLMRISYAVFCLKKKKKNYNEP